MGQVKLFNGIVTTKILAIITIIVVYLVMVSIFPELSTAGNSLSGVPLGSLFSPTGFAVILLMVFIFLFTVRQVMGIRPSLR